MQAKPEPVGLVVFKSQFAAIFRELTGISSVYCPGFRPNRLLVGPGGLSDPRPRVSGIASSQNVDKSGDRPGILL